MKINNFLQKNKYYIVIFVLLIVIPLLFKYVNSDLQILKNPFYKEDFLNLFENFQSNDSQIHYGDQVKISFDTPTDFDGFNKNQIYLTCGNNNNDDLKLNNIKETFTDDKMVYLDDNTNDLYQYWVVVGPNGTSEDFKLGEPVKKDETIRLQCLKNGGNLYLSPKILSTSFKVLKENDVNAQQNFIRQANHDIIAQGQYNKTDDNSNWTVKLDGVDTWMKNSKFRLVSKNGLSLNVNHKNEYFNMPTDSLEKYTTNKYNTGEFVFEKKSQPVSIDTNNLNKELSNINLQSFENGYNVINREFSEKNYFGFLYNQGTIYPVSKNEYEANKDRGNVSCQLYELTAMNPRKTIVTSSAKDSFNMQVIDVRSQETNNIIVYKNNEFKSIQGQYNIVSISKDKTSHIESFGDMDISSAIIPRGYSVKLYSEYQAGSDDNKFVKVIVNEIAQDVVFFGGNHNNFTYSKIQGLLIEKFCSGKIFEYSNYKGKMHCLGYGTHKMDKIGSWNISDNTDAKILTSYNDFEITGDSAFRNIANYRAINAVNLDTSNTIVLQPKGTDINIFRNLADLSSVKTMNVPRKSEELPYTIDSNNNIKNIRLDNVRLALDFSNPRTYNTLKPGRIVRDISGTNNHIVFDRIPPIKNGLLLDSANNKAFGPSPVNYDIGRAIQGYTIFLFAKRYRSTSNNILSLASIDPDYPEHGLNIHFTFNDNSIYFDNAFTKSNNYNSNKTRLSHLLSNEIFEQMNVFVFRKASDSNGGKLSIFLNGKFMKESSEPANRLFLDDSKYSKLFNNFNGSVQSMFVYNTHLDNNEIGDVVNWQYQNYNKYKLKLNKFQDKFLRKVLPELKIYNDLKCLVNSKDKLSSAIDSDKFTDLSGLDNNFKFLEIPTKNNGRYENIRNKGKFLVGPSGASLGIDRNTGYAIFITVRLLSDANYYLFNIKGNNEPLNIKSEKYNRGIALFVENGRLTLVQGQQNNNTISENVNRISTPIKDYINKTITIAIRNDVEKTNNKGKLEMYINNKLVAQGVKGTSSYVNLNSEPITICSPHNFDKLESNNVIMDGDLLNFTIYNRGLGIYHLEYVSSYLMKGFYGSDINIYGNKVKENANIPIDSNFCFETQLDGHLYSNTECLDWNAKDENGRYKNVLPNGAGWCFTKSDGSTRGFCLMDKDFKLVQSVQNDVKENEKESKEKIKKEAQREAEKQLVNKKVQSTVTPTQSQQQQASAQAGATQTGSAQAGSAQAGAAQTVNETFSNYEPFSNEISVETEFDFDGYNDYTDAVNKCISNKGRLCHAKEVSPGNSGTTNYNFYLNSTSFDNHPEYNKQKCQILGLNYDENTKRCWYSDQVNDPNLLPTMNIDNEGNKAPLWLPITMDEKDGIQFMNIAKGVSGVNVGDIEKDPTKIKPSERKLLKCCNVGNTSLCDGNRTRLRLMERDLKKLNQQITNLQSTNADPIRIKVAEEKRKELNEEMSKIQKKLWTECDKHNYYEALMSLKNFRKIYKELVNEHDKAVYNRSIIEKQMMKFIYFEDEQGVKHVENDSTRSRKRKGLIPDLENEIKKYKKLIKNELERIENCPVPNPYAVDGAKPSCRTLAKRERPTELPFAQQPKEEVENKKCTPNDIKNYLINSGKLSPETIVKLLQMSNTTNLLKDKDIRQHKDFFKYIKSSKVNSCPKAGKDAKITIKQKTVNDFNIKDHPDYKKHVRLDTLPENRVPKESMELWKKLKGLI